jgi:hypothetical protein
MNENELPTLSIRSAIDEITLRIALPGKKDLSNDITEQAIAYMARHLPRSRMTDEEIERVVEAIVRGVVKRLEQIAISGGRSGTG